VGGGIGIVVALILDWSLAWAAPAPPSTDAGSAHAADREAKPGRPTGFTITTAGLAPSTNGFNLVLGGRF